VSIQSAQNNFEPQILFVRVLLGDKIVMITSVSCRLGASKAELVSMAESCVDNVSVEAIVSGGSAEVDADVGAAITDSRETALPSL
jgi:hypothetical protein